MCLYGVYGRSKSLVVGVDRILKQVVLKLQTTNGNLEVDDVLTVIVDARIMSRDPRIYIGPAIAIGDQAK